jgi:hypothetical protein
MNEKMYMWIVILLSVMLIITVIFMDYENNRLRGYLDDTCKLFNHLTEVTNACTKNLATYTFVDYNELTPLVCYDDF